MDNAFNTKLELARVPFERWTGIHDKLNLLFGTEVMDNMSLDNHGGYTTGSNQMFEFFSDDISGTYEYATEIGNPEHIYVSIGDYLKFYVLDDTNYFDLIYFVNDEVHTVSGYVDPDDSSKMIMSTEVYSSSDLPSAFGSREEQLKLHAGGFRHFASFHEISPISSEETKIDINEGKKGFYEAIRGFVAIAKNAIQVEDSKGMKM